VWVHYEQTVRYRASGRVRWAQSTTPNSQCVAVEVREAGRLGRPARRSSPAQLVSRGERERGFGRTRLTRRNLFAGNTA
jgi:hypothetical protein